MKRKFYLVTGGTGFLGSALVRRLLQEGCRVRVLDNNSRGSAARLDDIINEIEYLEADIRDPEAVRAAARGVDSICHLAFINGTEFFYRRPELVLEVGVRGMLNVLDACRAEGVGELALASSSEVYQTPEKIPTDETAPLSIPDPHNPRYSYAAGKIISEMLSLHAGAKLCKRVLIFRPHNVYGPAMGWEHVIPQFILRLHRLLQKAGGKEAAIEFPLQGSGEQTRAFVYIDDFIDGLWQVLAHGRHLEIYHIGTDEETRIADLAKLVGDYFQHSLKLRPGPEPAGGTPRRCPDISKLRALGYAPKVSLPEGLARTAAWYVANANRAPRKAQEQE